MKYDRIALASLRGLALDEISKAKSGHPGMALSAAPLLYTLYTRHRNANPEDPNWFNRDRFILSAGHGSALLYALLHLAGYSIPIEQLRQFRQLGSLTPGHPEVGHTPGVDATSGPLGQGIAQAVGRAVAETHLASIYPDGGKLCNHYTYCLTGDGCLEEGISQEAISLAGVWHLNKLILLYDKNDCTLDGPLSNSSIEDTKGRFLAAGWNVLEVKDGNDIEEIDHALILAKTAKEKPTIIICHTVIGYGSELAGSHVSHGKAFSAEMVVKTKENLGVSFPPFEVPEEAYRAFKDTFVARGKKAEEEDKKVLLNYKELHKEEYERFLDLKDNNVAPYLFTDGPKYEDGFQDATRNTSQALLNIVAGELSNLFGGSADVADSVKTHVKSFTDYSKDNRKGENINFGIREFAMGAIQNGILLHGGLRTYVGCFLVFADYRKPSIRRAARERIPAIYLFSHDSLAVGEDGPTHQPIEQLARLRAIPRLNLFRPADAIETSAAYRSAFESVDHPTAIILSRQGLFNNPQSSFQGSLMGGYVVSKEKEKAVLTLIATGSEVNLAVQAQELLLADGIDVRVVSMPCTEIFNKQDASYQDEVFGNDYDHRVFIEMGKPDGNYRYAKNVFGVDDFGSSAPANQVLDSYGFTPEKIADRIKSLLA